MRNAFLALTLSSLLLPATPLVAQNGGPRYEQRARERHDNEKHDRHRRDHKADRREFKKDRRREISRYDYNRPDPRYGNYRADRYYVANNHYQARRLNRDDRIYRGSDNRYYCRRSDGTTGLIIGGLAGGVLGNVIAPGGSKTLGTLLGGGLGALLGRSVDRDGGNVTCR